MIGRGYLRSKPAEEPDSSGFDSFELRLGDLMRGERATMGKALLDVQRELKIKAAYIAAIENADPSAFETPGFIAGYVRSYARYLNMDPDWAFDTFCRESGFETAHGMSPASSTLRPTAREERGPEAGRGSGLGRDIFAGGGTSFLPASPGLLANVEPRAVGSILVLAALLGGLGTGGWMVLREVQKVTFAPVEQPPSVVAEVDPLAGGARAGEAAEAERVASIQVPSAEALDRLYRPEALEVPVLVPRDGPIAALDPRAVGVVPSGPAGAAPATAQLAATATMLASAPATAPLPVAPTAAGLGVDEALAAVLGAGSAAPPADPAAVQVTAGPAPEVQLVAVRESWVRVRAADGAVLFEGIMGPGDTFDVPATVEPATLRTGESGALYMALNGVPYGPVGAAGSVSSNVALSAQAVATSYQVADLTADAALADYVAVASAQDIQPAALPAGEVLPGAAPQAVETLPTPAD